MANGEKSPVEKARDWLKTQGYALEHATMRALQSASFYAAIGQTYVDENTGKVRDIDVIAQPFLRTRTKVPMFVVVECKSGGGLPWIVRRASIPDEELRWHPVGSPSVKAYAESQPTLRPFHVRDPTGIGLLSARDKGEEDRGYAALRQLLDAARGAHRSRFMPGDGPWLVHPILVIEAPLVTVDFLSDGTEEIRETGWERLVWSGGGDAPAVVDVVRSESVEEYAVVLRDELDRLNTVVLARTDYQFVEGPRFVSFP